MRHAVSDFGTAKFLNPDSANWSALAGTYGYVAPGNIVYALDLIFYLLTLFFFLMSTFTNSVTISFSVQNLLIQWK